MRTIKIFLSLLCLTCILFTSCEKEDTNLRLPERPEIQSSESKLRDSVYYYTYYFYLWQDKLPTSYAIHQFRTADLLLNSLRQFAKDPSGQPYDRFSFLDREKSINNEIQNAQYGDFGLDVRYLNDQDLYVKVAFENSPAYLNGVRRGWKVLEINGKTNLSVQEMEKDNFEFLFNSLYANTIQIKLQSPSNEVKSLNLNKATYNFNPILNHSILEKNNKKVGYLAFQSFVSQNLVQNQLNTIFAGFSSAGVESVIVDLRYNGGGDVSTANFISNLLAPSSAHDKLMNRYVINSLLTMEGWGFFLFGPEFFNKTNSLNIQDVYFLVSNGTASASELLINNLIPYMNVHLIGDDVTYGKPVGYFGWDIMGVDLYAVSFKTINASGQGDYFNGMTPDFFSRDDVSRNFGDSSELMTAAALEHVVSGNFPASSLNSSNLLMSSKGVRPSKGIDEANKVLASSKRKDMFDFNKSPRPNQVLNK